MPDRLRFFGLVVFRWFLLIPILIWSGLSNRDSVLSAVKWILPKSLWEGRENLVVMENWPWYVWAIGSLSILAGYVLESSYRQFRIEKEKAQNALEQLQEVTTPRLQIRWIPGEVTYHYEYGAEPNRGPSVHFRICIANVSQTAIVTDIRVVLERLTPHRLPCVPCSLRLMNNVLMPPVIDPRVERFSLNPGDHQFIDVMEQRAGSPAFNIWHTVVPQITTLVIKGDYRMTIAVTSSAPRISQDFELVENGELWDLRAVNER